MIVPGILVCSIFLITVCMFIVSKALLISCATLILRAGGAIWLNPFATVLFTGCSAVTIECCVLLPLLRGCVSYVCCYVRKRLFSSVFAITERRVTGIVPLSMSLVGFGMGTMLSNFHMCGIMLVLRAVFNMLVRAYVFQVPDV